MSDLMRRRKRLSEGEVRFYMRQLVEGLAYLHKALVIHRDLKLGNLFLTSDMRLKIGDFGLAARLDDPDDRKRTMCGTPNYIAPEILNGQRGDGHSFEVDIWSTGVVMYTMLVGRPPFETDDVKATYKLIRANQYDFPETAHVSRSAQSLVRSILRNDPGDVVGVPVAAGRGDGHRARKDRRATRVEEVVREHAALEAAEARLEIRRRQEGHARQALHVVDLRRDLDRRA